MLRSGCTVKSTSNRLANISVRYGMRERHAYLFEAAYGLADRSRPVLPCTVIRGWVPAHERTPSQIGLSLDTASG